MGDFPAQRIAFFVGMALIFLIDWFLICWIRARNAKQLLFVGLMWATQMLLFEFCLGILVLNYSWGRMLEDYDVSRGGLMGFELFFMAFAPYLAAKLRGVNLQLPS